MSQSYWVEFEVEIEVEIEAEVALKRLMLKWSWYEVKVEIEVEVELMFSLSWVELGLSWVEFELRAKMGFYKVLYGSKTFFRTTHIAEQNLFSKFLWFIYLILTQFCQKWAILWNEIRLKNSFGVYSYSATTFIFFVSFNYDIWF